MLQSIDWDGSLCCSIDKKCKPYKCIVCWFIHLRVLSFMAFAECIIGIITKVIRRSKKLNVYSTDRRSLIKEKKIDCCLSKINTTIAKIKTNMA